MKTHALTLPRVRHWHRWLGLLSVLALAPATGCKFNSSAEYSASTSTSAGGEAGSRSKRRRSSGGKAKASTTAKARAASNAESSTSSSASGNGVARTKARVSVSGVKHSVAVGRARTPRSPLGLRGRFTARLALANRLNQKARAKLKGKLAGRRGNSSETRSDVQTRDPRGKLMPKPRAVTASETQAPKSGSLGDALRQVTPAEKTPNENADKTPKKTPAKTPSGPDGKTPAKTPAKTPSDPADEPPSKKPVETPAPPPEAPPENEFGYAEPVLGCFEGHVFFIEEDSKALPASYKGLQPRSVLYACEWDIPTRKWDKGFPGVEDRFEWFAIRYAGAFQVAEGGTYTFRISSDDGARLIIDGEVVIDNDGVHPPREKSGSVELAAGDHEMILEYFQGPRFKINLQLFVTAPGAEEGLFSVRD